ncbi:MAG: CHAT domain-containing protein [Bacteroidia bacterium]|nr:CHAT domain-containing protein [Bacteroidia bacterium]MDW8347753.1 CHAT domain-containing protein [Bacteroidia bacterium]
MKISGLIVFLSLLSPIIKAQTWQSAYDSCLKYSKSNEHPKILLEWGIKTLELYEKQVSVKDTTYSKILDFLFYTSFNSEKYKDAEKFAKIDSAWSKNNQYLPGLANSYSNLGLLYKEQGRYSEAELLLKESKTINLNLLGENHPNYGKSCQNLGSIYFQMGKYMQAESNYLETKRIVEKHNGTESLEYANICNSLGLLYHYQGMYSKAISLYNVSRAIYAKILGERSKSYAIVCNNLGISYNSLGNIPQAEQLYSQARKTLQILKDTENLAYANICNNLSNVYISQGRYSEVEPLITEAKRIRLKLLGKNNPNYATYCSTLGGVYLDQQKYAKAESLLIESKEILLKTVGKNHELYSQNCINLAVTYEGQGRDDEAEKLYLEAENIMLNIQTQQRKYIELCINMGNFYVTQEKYQKAENVLLKAKNLAEKTFGKYHPLYANACGSLGFAYQKQGLYEEAEKFFKESIDMKLYEIQNNFRNLSEKDKEQYIKTNIQRYIDRFYLFSTKVYKNKPYFMGDIYNLTLETKGLILQSTEKIKNRIIKSQNQEIKELYLEWKQTKDKYVRVQNLSINQRQEKKIDLDSLERQINELEKQLALKSEDFAHTFTPKVITWKDIQKMLKKDQAGIEIIRAEYKQKAKSDSVVYIALIVKKDSQYPDVVIFNNGNQFENEHIIRYRRSITTKIQDKESYDVFWKPIAQKLKGIKTVYFSPDGIYHQINLSTLYNPETKKYVFDEVQVINVTSTKDITETRKFYAKNNFLIGNPKFNLELNLQNNEKPSEQRSIENLSQLEGAEREVKEISTFLQNSTTVVGIDATEEYVKSIKNPRILHIATHGYFKKGQYQSNMQAMLNAGLLFAGVIDYDKMEIRPLDKEDGKLTAFEVMNMELDSTELVVLSACETGLGQASKEGVYGLQRAFKIAGAQSIIMSLWKVNDEATQLLMTKFYENWQKKGMLKRKAFETAQKDIRKRYREPYYWGAFVMIE